MALLWVGFGIDGIIPGLRLRKACGNEGARPNGGHYRRRAAAFGNEPNAGGQTETEGF